jgi:hypothetical protein
LSNEVGNVVNVGACVVDTVGVTRDRAVDVVKGGSGRVVVDKDDGEDGVEVFVTTVDSVVVPAGAVIVEVGVSITIEDDDGATIVVVKMVVGWISTIEVETMPAFGVTVTIIVLLDGVGTSVMVRVAGVGVSTMVSVIGVAVLVTVSVAGVAVVTRIETTVVSVLPPSLVGPVELPELPSPPELPAPLEPPSMGTTVYLAARGCSRGDVVVLHLRKGKAEAGE